MWYRYLGIFAPLSKGHIAGNVQECRTSFTFLAKSPENSRKKLVLWVIMPSETAVTAHWAGVLRHICPFICQFIGTFGMETGDKVTKL